MIRSSLLLLIFLASFLLGMLLLFLLDGRRGRAPDEYLQRRHPGLHRFYALHLYEGSFRQDSLSLQSGNYPNAILMTIAFCAAFSPAAWAGYDLHITRAKEWTESKKTPVPVEGWVQYIKSDSEFRLVQPQDPKGKPRDAIWIDPKDKARVLFLLLGWRDSVKDPHERIIAKMKKVALRLNGEGCW